MYIVISITMKPDDEIKLNAQGFIPYSMCRIIVKTLCPSTVMVDLHYTNQKKDIIQHGVHIPYEHIA